MSIWFLIRPGVELAQLVLRHQPSRRVGVELGVGQHLLEQGQQGLGARTVVLLGVELHQPAEGVGVAGLDGQDLLAELDGLVGASQGADVDPAQPPEDGDRLGVELLRLLEQGHGIVVGSAILERPRGRVEPEGLGPLAIVDRAGAEGNEGTGRVVARLGEHRRDVGLHPGAAERGRRRSLLQIR